MLNCVSILQNISYNWALVCFQHSFVDISVSLLLLIRQYVSTSPGTLQVFHCQKNWKYCSCIKIRVKGALSSQSYNLCSNMLLFSVLLLRETLNMMWNVCYVCNVKMFISILTFRHRASCILGQAFHYSPEEAFYIFNQQIYLIIWYLLDRASLI